VVSGHSRRVRIETAEDVLDLNPELREATLQAADCTGNAQVRWERPVPACHS
jgi:hypothetical protein